MDPCPSLTLIARDLAMNVEGLSFFSWMYSKLLLFSESQFPLVSCTISVWAMMAKKWLLPGGRNLQSSSACRLQSCIESASLQESSGISLHVQGLGGYSLTSRINSWLPPKPCLTLHTRKIALGFLHHVGEVHSPVQSLEDSFVCHPDF